MGICGADMHGSAFVLTVFAGTMMVSNVATGVMSVAVMIPVLIIIGKKRDALEETSIT